MFVLFHFVVSVEEVLVELSILISGTSVTCSFKKECPK